MNEIAASNLPANPASDPAESPAAPATPIFVPTGKSSPTPGWKTSEFWMTTLSQASLVLATLSGAMPTKYAALFGTVAQVAYNVSRGMAKLNAAR